MSTSRNSSARPKCLHVPMVLVPILGLFVAHQPIGAQPPGNPVVPPTKVAQSAGGPTLFPNSASSGFEDPSVAAGTFFKYGTLNPPANVWQKWTWTGSSGIAANGSGFTQFNPSAPEGTRVAFLQGVASIQTTTVLRAGTWRLRFRGAQRARAMGHDHQAVRVFIGGVEFDEIEFEGTSYVDRATRPIVVGAATSISVMIESFNPHGGDHTALIDDVRLEPIAEWYDPSTWGGSVPGASDVVHIPDGVAVSLMSLGTVAGSIQVNGELLAANTNISLDVDWLMVSGSNARLEVGRPDTPFLQDFTLTLTAVDDGTNIMGAGSKFLMAMMAGTIELHGEPRLSWTRLNATALQNGNTLTLLDLVDWDFDDEIVIAGSNFQPQLLPANVPNYVSQAETAKILSVNGTTVTLQSNLAHTHVGGPPQVYNSSNDTWTLDQRAEVGLLTHNVKIQGDLASSSAGYGGHIMIMRPGVPDTGGVAHISSVELYRMGQTAKLGRYPMHWHVMLDHAVGQYFTDSSVHETYNRAVTIHGTDFVSCARNVAYRNLGHAVFLEDGSEQYNEIRDNLVIETLKPTDAQKVLPSDNELEQPQNRCPASFWITNPSNTIIGNVAACTEGTGFWFIFPESPLGLSSSQPYFSGRVPYQNDLGAFEDNVAHSCGSGFDVNDSIWIGAEPAHLDHSIKTNVAWEPSTTAVLRRFTTYACINGIYAGASDEDVRFDDCVVADCNEQIRLAAYHTVQNSLLVADSGNVALGGALRSGYVVYDGAGRLRDSYLDGFDQPGTFAYAATGGATLHPNNRASGLEYNHTGLPRIGFLDYASAVLPSGFPVDPNPTNSQNLADPRKWGMAVRDEDGSIWGTPGATLIGNHPMMYIPTPALDITPVGAVNQYSKLTPLRYGHLRFVSRSSSGQKFVKTDLPDIDVARLDNPTTSTPLPFVLPFPPPPTIAGSFFHYVFKNDQHHQFPVIVQDDFIYTVDWPAGFQTPSGTLVKQLEVTLDDVELGDSVYVCLRQLGALPSLAGPVGQQVTSAFALVYATSTSFWNDGTDVWIKYVAVPDEETLIFTW
ncbi:MAG: G8 domain-containing protein [Planctomycetes bacterium]|nr:G8 domain-containing protein [Planctomycetota bacterium]